jgi:hypothetical protein
VLALGAAVPASAATVPFSSPGCSSWTVPAGVSSVAIDAVGASGTGGGGSNGGHGGIGDEVKGSVAVTHGQALDVCVDVGGGQGASSGGAGGGAAGVSLGSDFSSPVIVAAGGGGGGGAGSLAGGSGGAAGASGSSAAGGAAGGGAGAGSSANSSGPGAGASGTGSGGGGGGGYAGGGGGSGNNLGGGGGGGGTNYCSASGCSTQTASAAPAVTLAYTVASTPSASIAAPVNGATYALGQAVASSFGCAEGAAGSGISSCVDENGQRSGAPIDTSTAGSHTLTVTATSSDGLSSSSSVTYTVAAPPVVWLPLPSDGAVYTIGQVVDSWYECGEGTGGPGLTSCVDQQGRTSGAQIDTSTPGSHTFTVTATSGDGQTASTTVTYRVIPLPTVSHVAVHRGGLITLNLTAYGPGTADVFSTAGLRSFALAADAGTGVEIHPPNGTFVFGSFHQVFAGSGTVSVKLRLTQAGQLLLRAHRTAMLRVWVVFTPADGPPELAGSRVARISR